MKEDQDAFGKHLLTQFEVLSKGEPISAEIVERDDNYVDFGSTSRMYFSEYEEWSEIERQMIDKASGKVLDIGCGAGQHSLYLQKKGIDVTGIDKSPGAVEVCKLRGLEKALVRPISEIDNFEPDKFDTILMFGNNFGLFGSAEGASEILEKMHRITTPHAQIIAGTLNPHMTFAGEWFDYLFVSPEEMEMILKGCSWRIKELFNSEEARYFAVLEKKPLSI